MLYFPSTLLITFPFHVAPAYFFKIGMDFKDAEHLTWSFVCSHSCGCYNDEHQTLSFVCSQAFKIAFQQLK